MDWHSREHHSQTNYGQNGPHGLARRVSGVCLQMLGAPVVFLVEFRGLQGSQQSNDVFGAANREPNGNHGIESEIEKDIKLPV
jgi:hypothetical protein